MVAALPRTLSLYVARMLLVRTFAFLVGLVLVLQTLDLLQESDEILAIAGNGNDELIRYLTYRLPQLISQFLPFSVLLGSLLTLSSLNQNSEIIIMKSTGLSAHAILLPLLLTALGIAVTHFTFNEAVLTKANARLTAWQNAEYDASRMTAEKSRTIWLMDEDTVVQADQLKVIPGGMELSGVELYRRAAKDGMDRYIHAERALYSRESGWTLLNTTTTNIITSSTTRMDRLPWTTTIPPERFAAVAVDAKQVGIAELYRAIRDLRGSGFQSRGLLAGLYHKFAGPLSSVLMPLLGAVAGFGLARSGKLFVRVVIGMMLGFAYFVADNFMLAMGQFGAAPPLMAAWAPFLLFILVGESVLFRTEE